MVAGFKKRKDGGGDGSVALIDPRTKHRTEEQKDAVFYFSPENQPVFNGGCFPKPGGCFPKPKKKPRKGCFSAEKVKGCFSAKKDKGCFSNVSKKHKYISDAEYDAIVKAVLDRLDPYHRALAKLNVDESQVQEISPITFGNFKYRSQLEEKVKDRFYWKIGEDGLFRSNIYEVTWLFFSANQIFVYQLTLSTDWQKHDERTYEYYYKDITAFNSTTVQEDVIIDNETTEYQVVENLFEIKVPGDSFACVLSNKSNEKEEGSIQAMKAMLREKKN
jgi:hypothetical protein